MKKRYLLLTSLVAVIGCNQTENPISTNVVSSTSSPLISSSQVTSSTTSVVEGLTDSEAYPDAALTKLTLSGSADSKIKEVYEAKIDNQLDGYLYVLSSTGFSQSKPIVFHLGISLEEKFKGYKVIDFSGESHGGVKIASDEDFMNQFKNDRDIAYEFDVIAGATTSSNGVISAVDAAIDHFENNFVDEPK